MNTITQLHNELTKRDLLVKKRIKRCQYLKDRADCMARIGNLEQAEAYAVRLELHKLKLIELIEEIERIEQRIEKLSKLKS